jgi:hypothetical protein
LFFASWQLLMSEDARTTCSETGRPFDSPEAARASEARFREIQAECDAGRVPELRAGDVIYVESERYISHGCDDFQGGLAEVSEIRYSDSPGRPGMMVCVAQQPGGFYNWNRLAAEQKQLRREHGANWAHPDPDLRPEHNGYFL